MNAPASALALVLAGSCVLLAPACGSVKPAYSPAQAKACTAIEGAYMSRVLAACPGVTYDDCAAVPGLQADRTAEQVRAGCR